MCTLCVQSVHFSQILYNIVYTQKVYKLVKLVNFQICQN